MDIALAGRLARALAWLTPLALLAGAYISQIGFGLFPCEMCWWQRYAHFAALGLGLAAAMRPSGWVLTALAALALSLSAAIGLHHAGVEYGWWDGLSRCTSTVLAVGDDALDAIMNAPIVRCDVAPWSLMGVSLAGWNFLFSGAAALAITLLLLTPRKVAA